VVIMWVGVLFLLLGGAVGFIPLNLKGSMARRLQRPIYGALGASSKPDTIVSMEDDDEDDDDDELLSFQVETDFLQSMKALVDKTSAFSIDPKKDAAFEVQREKKTEMLEELKRIDGTLDISSDIDKEGGELISTSSVAMSKEGLVEDLRRAFAGDQKEPELEDYLPDIPQPSDDSAQYMVENVEAGVSADDSEGDGDGEGVLNKLRQVFSSDRDGAAAGGGGEGEGISKASQMLKSVAASASASASASTRVVSEQEQRVVENNARVAASNPMADSMAQARTNLYDSLSQGLPPELRQLKKCPVCKKPATQAELADLGKCSFCRQDELSVPRPLLSRAPPRAAAAQASGKSPAASTTASTPFSSYPEQKQQQSRQQTVYQPRKPASAPRAPAAAPVQQKQQQQQQQQQQHSDYSNSDSGQQYRGRSSRGDYQQPQYDNQQQQYDNNYRGAGNYPPAGGYEYYRDQEYDGGLLGGYEQLEERDAAIMEQMLELEREVLYLRALVKQLEEGLVPQVDDLRTRMDSVLQVLWNTGSV
jgi:hypothetical protein